MSNLLRTTHKRRCPICNKPDWCMIGKDIAICMRVESKKPYTFKNGALGWIHNLTEPIPWTPPPKQERPVIKAKEMLEKWDGQNLSHIATQLGVTIESLSALGCVWAPAHRAWAFPMRGGTGEYRGIRLRADDGRKWAVTGSREGVFFTFGNPNDPVLWVVEGPTDTAAGLTLGLDVVGRPSCYGGVDEIRTIVRNSKYRRVVIVSDNDDVGRRGARMLSDALFVPRCIITLPCKDMRQFVNDGGERSVLDYLVRNTVWTTPMKGTV